MCGLKFCSMKINQYVRDPFSDQEKGMASKSKKFIDSGGETYKPMAS
jgi:hypothetical protein